MEKYTYRSINHIVPQYSSGDHSEHQNHSEHSAEWSVELLAGATLSELQLLCRKLGT